METFGNPIFLGELVNTIDTLTSGKNKKKKNSKLALTKKMETFGNPNNLTKNTPKYSCFFCDYNTSRKSSYDKHLTTSKHINNKKLQIRNKKLQKNDENSENSEKIDEISKNSKKISKNSKNSKENLKNSEKFDENSKNSKENLKNSEKIDEISKNSKENSENSKNSKENLKNSEKFDEISENSKNSKENSENSKNPKKKSENSKNSKKNYFCENCEKNFLSKSGLWKHQKKCLNYNEFHIKNNDIIEQNLQEAHQIIVEQFKVNTELTKQNTELAMKMVNLSKENKIINNNTQINQINLQIFLNESCKDALNITDFVGSLRLRLNDLENVGKVGYVDGMSNIIVDGLKKLEVNQRPIHCTDEEETTLYVKDNDVWEREDKDPERMKKVIEILRRENIKQLPSWIEENPKCTNSNTNEEGKYMSILKNSLGGSTKEEVDRNDGEIIKNVAKEVSIENTQMITSVEK